MQYYWNELSSETVDMLRNAVEYKGIEQFDYILCEQSDELIDNDKLTEDFLSMYDKLDLLYTEEEKDIMSSNLRTESNIFIQEVEKITEWCEEAQEKAVERLEERKNKNIER